MSQNPSSATTVIGIDIGKNSFHVVGLDDRGGIILRQKLHPMESPAGRAVRGLSRGQKNDFRDAEAIAEAVQRPAS